MGASSTLYRDPSGAPEVAWDAPDFVPDPNATTPDVSKLPGAKIVADVAFAGDGVVVRAGCARGPSDRFAKGIEDVLLDRATAFALKAAGAAPSEIAITDSGGSIDEGLVTRDLDGKSDGKAFHIH